MKKPDIRAAGAVVLRQRNDHQDVLVVHRPRYDDWSLPKGKLERNEIAATCAVREVEEETGARVRLVQALGSHRYLVAGNKVKHVDWWRAELVAGGAAEVMAAADPSEVDEVAWLPVSEAKERLAYAEEGERLLEALAQPPVTPLLVLRHAKALQRKRWQAKDSERPITEWGHRQTRALVPLLAAFGVRRVVSSSAVRCLQTVTPYALRHGLSLEGWHELTEERFENDPKDVRRVMAEMAQHTGESGVPTVVCGHRPVFPDMLGAMSAPDHTFATAETFVLSLLSDGTVHDTQAILQRLSR